MAETGSEKGQVILGEERSILFRIRIFVLLSQYSYAARTTAVRIISVLYIYLFI